MKYVKPRWVFIVYMTLIIVSHEPRILRTSQKADLPSQVFISPAITQTGMTGVIMLYLTLFFESIIFPTIMALGMRGLGKYTKRGSGYIVGGVCGGALVPPLLGVAADARSTAFAMLVPLMFFIAAWTYAFAVNFVPAYRTPVDMFSKTKVGLEPTTSEELGAGKGDAGGIERIESDGSTEMRESKI